MPKVEGNYFTRLISFLSHIWISLSKSYSSSFRTFSESLSGASGTLKENIGSAVWNNLSSFQHSLSRLLLCTSSYLSHGGWFWVFGRRMNPVRKRHLLAADAQPSSFMFHMLSGRLMKPRPIVYHGFKELKYQRNKKYEKREFLNPGHLFLVFLFLIFGASGAGTFLAFRASAQRMLLVSPPSLSLLLGNNDYIEPVIKEILTL